MKKRNFKITTTKCELKEGLFGQVVLYVFEILPYLYSKAIFPEWDIKSVLYGAEPNFTIMPGVFDLAYETSNASIRERRLGRLRKNHISVLGGDWESLHNLWHSYFRIPPRIIKKASETGDLSKTLGVHYRGTDKKNAEWDTNPVTHEEYIILIKDFIFEHSEIDSLFVATDEYTFVDSIKNHFMSYRIINLGEVGFHKNTDNVQNKGDRAVLDCFLLSRCKYILQTSSALSGFAKVLNPDIESYRVSASKLFTDIPYFPIAYIPVLTSKDVNCNHILKKLLKDDWLQNSKANKKYKDNFYTKKRHIWPIILRQFTVLVTRFKNIFLRIFRLLSFSKTAS